MTESCYSKTKVKNDKETMIALVSHDLKNPVNAGIMAVKLLEDTKLSPLNPYQKEIVETMSDGFKYMKNLIENILDRYRVINNAYKLNKIPVDFINLVQSVIEESKYLFQDKMQKVSFESFVENRRIYIDNLEMRRVINNLISNASTYSPDMSEIKIKIYDKKQNMYFSIENEGCKFKDPKEVFERFFTKNNNTKTISTGLGLFIVKEIVKAHGGKIFVESEVDKFTRIIFLIPIK